MKMDLRLLKNQRRAFWRVVAESQYRQDLQNTEADVPLSTHRVPSIPAHRHLKQLSAFGNRADLETVDKTKILQPTR